MVEQASAGAPIGIGTYLWWRRRSWTPAAPSAVEVQAR